MYLMDDPEDDVWSWLWPYLNTTQVREGGSAGRRDGESTTSCDPPSLTRLSLLRLSLSILLSLSLVSAVNVYFEHRQRSISLCATGRHRLCVVPLSILQDRMCTRKHQRRLQHCAIDNTNVLP